MSRISATLTRSNVRGAFDAYYRNAVQRIERAALVATDKGGRIAERRIRADMQGAGLGRMGQAIKAESDLESGRGIYRYGQGGFSASSTIAIRSGSRRTRGAIEAYTQGAEIRPVRSRWLWIPTDEIPRVTGRYRMTPELYRKNGFERKIGPLVQVRSVNGYPLLVARNVGVSAAGLPRRAKSLTKSGRARKGQRIKEFVVAFIGIPRTARAARVDVAAIVRDVAQQLPELWAQEIRKGGR